MLGTNTGIVRPVVPGYIYMPHALAPLIHGPV